MRPIEEVQAEVLEAMPLLPVEATPLVDSLGLVLAEPVVAGHDLPPFANSAVDGYAVRIADLASLPADLAVLEEVAAGSVATSSVVAGAAIKVMTGAPVPDGTEAVVKVENTESGNGRVTVLVAVPPGEAIRPAGGDVPAGSAVLSPGERLAPAHLGVLASLGVAQPLVRRRPIVAVMSTGDEIVAPEVEALGPGLIRDANRFILIGLLEDLGATVVDHGIVPDDADALNRALSDAASADVVVTSGGVSMGDYDIVKEELLKLGTVAFWRIAMQPAKPFGFGRLGSTPFFGLPGNPVSVMVAFEQFVRPSLLKMMGADRIFRPRFTGVLDEPVTTDPEKTVFLRVVTRLDSDDVLHARSAGGQSSNVLSALAAADAFAVVPGVGDVPAGGPVTLEMFKMPSTRTRDEALDGR